MSSDTKKVREQILARRAALMATTVGGAVALSCCAKAENRRDGPCLSIIFCPETNPNCDVCLSISPQGGAPSLGGGGGIGGSSEPFDGGGAGGETT